MVGGAVISLQQEGHWEAFALWVVIVAIWTAAALLVGTNPQLALYLVLLLLPSAWLFQPEASGMAAFVFFNVFTICIPRFVDAADPGAGAPKLPWRLRLLHFGICVGAPELPVKTKPRFDGRAQVHAVVALGLAVGCGYAMLLPWLPMYVRCFSYGIHLGGILGAVAEQARVVMQLLGVATVNPFYRDPFKSRSLKELWGKRWNLMTQRPLRRLVFDPLVWCGLPRGVAAAGTFAVTAALHYFPLVFARKMTIQAALAMTVFFESQAVLLVVERWFKPEKWRAPLGTLWVTVALVGPSPWGLAPVFEIMGSPLDCGVLKSVFWC
eukprot:CAMPEP_0204358474 /NCGR_PEP_ID=MMETSP0469-20131031/36547_1 /ASSEMBLY_ACC=CAM_ASM_000384 /TAXON_ID=2969 /ORGANISM="Oxyrrhis marina" /LENGTH=323 /DNA_ID=CAMNT_0051346351 /DNA_START=39 /DNA_END=1010 /DNA_ORIENTATION=+